MHDNSFLDIPSFSRTQLLFLHGKFDTEFDHVTSDVLQTLKVDNVKGQGHSVKTSSDRQVIALF